MSVSASAPGKLVLSGEYAVLDSAPAICMAVNRRARVTVAESDTDCHVIYAPGFSSATGCFRSDAGDFEWLSGGEDFTLVQHVWQAANVSTGRSLSVSLDSSEFADAASGTKIGIGSSAALTVALAGALKQFAAGNSDATQTAFSAHRKFQNGLGSGVDVACSTLGGLIEYSMSAGTGSSIAWPDGLFIGVIWVGVPSSTSGKLRHLQQQYPRPSRAALVLAARRLAAAWRGGSVGAILDEYHDYTRVLREFSIDHELGIFDAGHAELAAEAEGAGVVYKPCGAGGGDTGVVLAADQGAVDAFINMAKTMNVHHLDARLDPQGVLVRRESS